MNKLARKTSNFGAGTPLTVFMDQLPEVTTRLRNGQTKHSVWNWLRNEGFQATYKTFLNYCKTSGLSGCRRALAGEAATQFVERFSFRGFESGRGTELGIAKPLKEAPRFVPPFEERD